MHLLPRDEKFFDLLTEQARIVYEASTLLAKGLQADPRNTVQQIRELERSGDLALRAIHRRLHKTFITPIDPEDVHELASRIDEILDHIDAVAYRFEAYGLERCPDQIFEIARMVDSCVEATLEAVQTLQREGLKQPERLTGRCDEINRRELATEERVRAVIRDLFANERDPIELIKKKEVYEMLEKTADCCEDVADIVEAIAVKNS